MTSPPPSRTGYPRVRRWNHTRGGPRWNPSRIAPVAGRRQMVGALEDDVLRGGRRRPRRRGTPPRRRSARGSRGARGQGARTDRPAPGWAAAQARAWRNAPGRTRPSPRPRLARISSPSPRGQPAEPRGRGDRRRAGGVEHARARSAIGQRRTGRLASRSGRGWRRASSRPASVSVPSVSKAPRGEVPRRVERDAELALAGDDNLQQLDRVQPEARLRTRGVAGAAVRRASGSGRPRARRAPGSRRRERIGRPHDGAAAPEEGDARRGGRRLPFGRRGSDGTSSKVAGPRPGRQACRRRVAPHRAARRQVRLALEHGAERGAGRAAERHHDRVGHARDPAQHGRDRRPG